MEPREFFIEERLESYRTNCFCNLGESGFHPMDLGQAIAYAGLGTDELFSIPLNDSPNRGRSDLRQEIAKLYPGVSPEEVLVTTGTSEALYLLFHLCIHPGAKVALYWPAFQALYEIPKMLGAEIIKVPVNQSLQISDWKSVEADFYILNQPHNPTGACFSPDDWSDLKTVLKSKNKPVLFDEHYRFLDLNSPLGETGVSPGDRFFGTGSFTKCFGVTGLRVGWLVANREIIERARSFKDYLTHTVSPVSERIALGLLQNRNLFLPAIRSELKENLEFWNSHLSRLTDIVSFGQVGGGLVGWAKLKPGISSEAYCDSLLRKTGVFVLPGINFEEEGHLRIGFGEKSSVFQEGVLRWVRNTPIL